MEKIKGKREYLYHDHVETDTIEKDCSYGYYNIVKSKFNKIEWYNRERYMTTSAGNNRRRLTLLFLRYTSSEVHNEYPLRMAATYGDLRMFNTLIQHGSDLYTQNFYCVFWSTYSGHYNIVKRIYEIADPKKLYQNHERAISAAIENRRIKILRFLLSLNIPTEYDSSISR
jgi:hypothetical protein